MLAPRRWRERRLTARADRLSSRAGEKAELARDCRERGTRPQGMASAKCWRSEPDLGGSGDPLTVRCMPMFSIRATTLTAAVVLSVASLGACSKQERAAIADSAASALPIPADTTPKALEVGDIDMGRHIGPDQKVTDKTDDFMPKDTIFAAVATKN